MSKGPALTDSYSLLTLPRVPDVDLQHKVVTPVLRSTEAGEVDLGVSKSIISSYLLKPTPKLIWSYPLSPSTLINSMDVFQDASHKHYAVGLTERRKFRLLLIKRDDIESEKTVTSEIKLHSQAVAVKFSETGLHVYVLLHTGEVELYSVGDDLEKVELETEFQPHQGEVIFHHFITEHTFNQENDLLLTVSKGKGNALTYSLVSLRLSKTFSINSETIDEKTNAKYLGFCYNSGYFYKLNAKTQQVSCMHVLNFEVLKTISVAGIVDEKSVFSMSCPSLDRLVISANNTIYLVSFKFASVLDTHVSKGDVHVNQVVSTRGETLKTTDTFAIYLDCDKSLNNVFLNIINVNVGTNILSECLGKSISNLVQEPAGFEGLPDILGEKLSLENEKNVKELNKVFASLRKLSEAANVSEFDKTFLKFMKNKKDTQDAVFDVNKDRTVGLSFILSVLSLIFNNTDGLQFQNDSFVPEASLLYLLTHACYPHEYSRGLLELFQKSQESRLLRQAIITCSSISMEELLIQFNSQTNETSEDESYQQEILKDIIHRLVSEYSIGEITAQFKKLFKQQSLLERNEVDVNLNKMLSQIIAINTSESLELLQVIIDVGGLFNWSMGTVASLETIVETKIQALLGNSYSLTLINQIMAKSDGKKKKGAKSSKIIAGDSYQKQQLDSILTISNGTSKIVYDEDDFEVSDRTPKYSVEKLVV